MKSKKNLKRKRDNEIKKNERNWKERNIMREKKNEIN